MVVVECVTRRDDNRFLVEFLSEYIDANVVKSVCEYLFVQHKYYRKCDRFLIECKLEGKLNKGKVNEYVLDVYIQPLSFDDIFCDIYDDNAYVFIYDGSIKPQLTPKYAHDLIGFKFYDIGIYGLEETIKEEYGHIKGYMILNYLGVDFESQLVLYEVSDRLMNPIFDIILCDGKIINKDVYKWFAGDHAADYYNMCELHKKFISFIEWLCSNYLDECSDVYDFINNQKLLVKQLKLDVIWNLVVDGYTFDVYYTEHNEIVATHDLEYLSKELSRLKLAMGMHIDIGAEKDEDTDTNATITIPTEEYEELKRKAELFDKIKALVDEQSID